MGKILQKRDAALLKLTEGYLHYLMKGLNGLPTLPEKEFYRGIPAEYLGVFQQHYTNGRVIHWSGLTSISEEEHVAKEFAGVGGIIMKVRARSARSIKQYSAFP